jgi:lysophospholipase L1-like esterase
MYGDSRAQDWPTGDVMSGYRIVNRGIGAQTTAQVLGRFEAHIVKEQPSVVVVQVGINDLKAIPLFPNEESWIVANCKANIEEIVAKSRAIGAQVVLSTVFPVGRVPIERLPVWSDRVPASILEVNEFIASLAGPDVVVLDSWSVLANEQGQMRPEYSLDTLHVNAAGYEALNTELEGILEQLNQ